MSELWFISDLHLGHKNILEYQPKERPFDTLEHMHQILIENWNRVVKKFDKVIVVGDFAFGSYNIELAGQLNGQKRLVMGNHDCYKAELYLKHFLSLHGAMFWNEYVITHIPVHTSQLEHRSKYNIHGHLHSKVIDDPRYINVSVEQTNLTPLNADVIIERMKDYEQRRNNSVK